MPSVTSISTQIIGVITHLSITMSIKRTGGGWHWFRRKRFRNVPPDIQYTAVIQVRQKEDGKLWMVTVEGCPTGFIEKCQEAYDKQLVTTFTITRDEP